MSLLDLFRRKKSAPVVQQPAPLPPPTIEELRATAVAAAEALRADAKKSAERYFEHALVKAREAAAMGKPGASLVVSYKGRDVGEFMARQLMIKLRKHGFTDVRDGRYGPDFVHVYFGWDHTS